MQKKTSYLIACLLLTMVTLVVGCRKSEELTCADIPKSINVDCLNYTPGQDNLERGARSLSLSYYSEFGITPADAFIPDSIWMPYFTALSAVQRAIPLMGCENLAPFLEIQPHANPSAYGLSIVVDTSFSWTRNWADGEVVTGVQALDSLVQVYNLNLEYYLEENGEGKGWATLSGDEILNIPVLMGYFDGIDGIMEVGHTGYIADMPNVTAHYEGDDLVLNYSRGYIDCTGGCVHSASFRVTPDCLVIYE